MDTLILSAQPDKAVAAVVIIIAFGLGLAGGLFAYFKIIKSNDKNKKP